MAQLYFRYGAMGSSKTANALMVNYNYHERGKNAIILKPGLENRDGATIIRSRIGLEAECIVDEAQFLTAEQVDMLSDIVDFDKVPVICYGLRTDFQERFFPGSARLMEIADKIEEVNTVCWCGRKATCNARICDGKIVRSGEQVLMGGNESYIALCRKHFKKGKLTV